LPAPARAPSAKETQTLTTLAPKPRPEPKRASTAAPAAASGSVEVTPSKIPDTVNVPSVVIEGSSNEKTAPAVPAKLPHPTAAAPPTFDDRPTMERSTAAPLPPTPADAPAPRKHKADPTGEWFSSDSQPVPIVKGAGRLR
ncbi:MAG: hypothetical protein ACXVCV_02225, partial [Polyangia bacterium]